MLGDTIHAVATPPGAAERGVVRVSGPKALPAVEALLQHGGGGLGSKRTALRVTLRVPLAPGAVDAPVQATAVVMPGPASYTGEDVVEIHVPGSPLLLAAIGAQLESMEEVRQALPGEFTRRAYEHGRMDLAAAEGVLRLIHAGSERERAQAVAAVSGGLGDQVAAVRDRLERAAALLEAGLDFEAGETGEVPVAAWLPGIEAARGELQLLLDGMPAATGGGALALVGRSNAGKSSLTNALVGREVALVWDGPGTTRDVLRVELPGAGGAVLLDGPGDLDRDGLERVGLDSDGGSATDGPAADGPAADRAAVALREQLFADAAGLLWVVSADGEDRGKAAARDIRLAPAGWPPVVALVVTKLDAMSDGVAEVIPPEAFAEELRQAAGLPPDVPVFLTSAVKKTGIGTLRGWLGHRAHAPVDAGGSAFRQHVLRASEGVQGALAGAGALPDELVALELRGAWESLDGIVGRTTPDTVLDKLFAGFCLGK